MKDKRKLISLSNFTSLDQVFQSTPFYLANGIYMHES